MNSNHMIRIVSLLGSVRPGNYTKKALAIVIDQLEKTDGVSQISYDPVNIDLPLPGSGGGSPELKAMQAEVKNADGVVIATPEYHGGISSVTKLFLENLGFPSGLAGKPVALLGVAAGEIGAIKSLEQLRSICSHVGAIVLPGPVSVAKVQTLFDDSDKIVDPAIEKRIRRVGSNLVDYVHQNVCPRFALESMVRGTAG